MSATETFRILFLGYCLQHHATLPDSQASQGTPETFGDFVLYLYEGLWAVHALVYRTLDELGHPLEYRDIYIPPK